MTSQLEQLLHHLDAGQPVYPGTDLYAIMVHYSNEAMELTARLNRDYHQPPEIRQLMEKITGKPVDPSFMLFPPFYTDFGKNIHIGKNVFINSCCNFQDQGGIWINDGCLIGHKVIIATINHGFAVADRATNYPRPVHVGRNVWIGANVTLLPGVRIGDNSIIAAGAVVSRDVEPGVIVAGVPARYIRHIPAE